VYRSISSVDRMTQEPEKIKRWREDQKSRIEAKDVEEEVRKRELRDAAKHELEEWYRQRSDQLIKNKETNKQ
jgi:clathrin light chain B